MSGNVKLALSHVVPDLVLKVLQGQDPLHILGEGNQVRHYTYGGDLARGIRLAMESPKAVNEDFNLSTATSTTVLELAETIWRKVHGPTAGRSATSPTRRSSTTSSAACPTSARPARCSASRRRRRSTRCSTRSSRGSAAELAGGGMTARAMDARPTIYDHRFGDADVKVKDAIWREIGAYLQRWIPANAQVLDVGLRSSATSSATSGPASAGRPTSATSPSSIGPDVRFVRGRRARAEQRRPARPPSTSRS